MRELRRPISDGNVVNLFPNINLQIPNKEKREERREKREERREEKRFSDMLRTDKRVTISCEKREKRREKREERREKREERREKREERREEIF